MTIFLTFFWTVILLVLIVAVCSLFTNGIEWVGKRFNLSQGAVGSVLAAVGTALPETLVPIVALIAGATSGSVSTHVASEIGIGAILGAPFLLGTLAMFVTGVAVFYFTSRGKRTLEMPIDLHLFRRDFQYFFIAYILVFLASYIAVTWVKTALAIGLVLFYAGYVYRTLKKEHIPDAEFELEPLNFAPKQAEPPTGMILLQVLVSLSGILILAHLFVTQIHHLSDLLHLDALILSLIISPIATELPEKFNSVMWIGNRKDNLALGNITGAMVFQSCIPTAIGLLFTPWQLNSQGTLSVILCLISSALIYGFVRLRERLTPQILLFGGLFYLIFIGYSFLAMKGMI